MRCSVTREIFHRRDLARTVQKHALMIGRAAAPFNERTRSDIKCREFGGDLTGRTKKTAEREEINLLNGSSSAPEQQGFSKIADRF
jgi:hypothetical protein